MLKGCICSLLFISFLSFSASARPSKLSIASQVANVLMDSDGNVSLSYPNDSTDLLSIELKVFFRQNVSKLELSYRDNEAHIANFVRAIKTAADSSDYSIQDITIRASASPEGSIEFNKKISLERGLSLSKALQQRLDLPDSSFVVDAIGIDWEGLRNLISDAKFSGKPEVLAILDKCMADTIDTEAESKHCKIAMSKVDGGKPYSYIYSNIYPQLRSASNNVLCHLVPKTTIKTDAKAEPETPVVIDIPVVVEIPVMEETFAEPETQELSEVSAEQAVQEPETPVVLEEPKSLLSETATPFQAHQFSLKTNLLYDAAAVANLAASYGFCKHFEAQVMAAFSPWDLAENFKIRTLTLQPSLRYYLKPGFRKIYVGAEGYCSWYNVAMKNSKKRYQDRNGDTPMLGGGIVLGYNWLMGKHFGIDFSVSGGYVESEYDIFYNLENGARITTDHLEWLGPTGASISIYYRF